MDNQIIVSESNDPLDALVEDIDKETFPEQYPDEEPEVKAAEEPEEEGEPEAEEPEYVEITYKGKPVKLTAEEVLENASKGFDYTQKTMELAETRRAVEAQAQLLQRQYEIQQQVLQEAAQLIAMDAQIEQYQNVNWDGWIDQDPIEAQKAWQKYQTLLSRKQEAHVGYNSKLGHLDQVQKANRNRQLAEAAEVVRREVKGWTPDLDTAYTNSAIEQYGHLGISRSVLETVAHIPGAHAILNDAYQWRRLQESKPQTLKKVTDAPKAAKPNSKTVDAQAKRGQLMKQLKQARSDKSRRAIADSLLDAYV